MKTRYASIGKTIVVEVSPADLSRRDKLTLLRDLLDEFGFNEFLAAPEAAGFVKWFDEVLAG